MTERRDTESEIEDEGPNRPLEVTYDAGTDELASEAVVRAVAAVVDVSPIALDPLYDVIDPVHLDETFERAARETETQLSFTFNGCAVTVTDEEVRVRSHEGDAAEP